MRGTGLMPDEDVADFGVLEKRIINGQHRAAGIAEHGVHTLGEQGVYQYVCAGFFGHFVHLLFSQSLRISQFARLMLQCSRAGKSRVTRY
jgi:hypothetical protein